MFGETRGFPHLFGFSDGFLTTLRERRTEGLLRARASCWVGDLADRLGTPWGPLGDPLGTPGDGFSQGEQLHAIGSNMRVVSHGKGDFTSSNGNIMGDK